MLLAEFHLPSVVSLHLQWFVAVAVIVIGLLLVGVGDIAKIFTDGGLKRAWAISSVCFRESIRRRVLWITPVAILAVIVAVQLLNPVDDQDAIRQTVKYALFTSGTLVVLVTIILACTNLPREIENRVIFTIVTKPTTRLEIVLGKIIGFARVSATILLIMGLFTWAYAHTRAAGFTTKARTRLEAISPNDPAKPALNYAVQHGFLESKNCVYPASYEEYARAPKSEDAFRWITGDGEQSIFVPFDLPDDLIPKGAPPEANGGLRIEARIEYEPEDKNWGNPDWHPTPFPGEIPDPDAYPKYRLMKSAPGVEFEVFSPGRYTLIPPNELSNGGHVALSLRRPAKMREMVDIPARQLDKLYKIPPEPAHRIYIRVTGSGPFNYGMGPGMLRLFSPKLNRYLDPVPAADGKKPWPEFHGRDFMGNQQLKCASDPAKALVGVFSFQNAHIPDDAGPVSFELRCIIEGSGDDTSAQEAPTRIFIDVSNRNGQSTAPIQFNIESNRMTYFTIPAAAVAGGDFDVHLRAVAPGRYLTFRTGTSSPSLLAIASTEPFAINLVKSLVVMWMLSLLVVIVAIFCSTFVSWPIAVVLTVVILMVNWGAQQIGGSNSGLGATMARDLGVRDPATSKVFGTAVEGLTSLLNNVAKVMPDISQFSSLEDIERSISISPHVLFDSLKVILAFGVPLIVLAYVFLKRKEVAP